MFGTGRIYLTLQMWNWRGCMKGRAATHWKKSESPHEFHCWCSSGGQTGRPRQPVLDAPHAARKQTELVFRKQIKTQNKAPSKHTYWSIRPLTNCKWLWSDGNFTSGRLLLRLVRQKYSSRAIDCCMFGGNWRKACVPSVIKISSATPTSAWNVLWFVEETSRAWCQTLLSSALFCWTSFHSSSEKNNKLKHISSCIYWYSMLLCMGHIIPTCCI